MIKNKLHALLAALATAGLSAPLAAQTAPASAAATDAVRMEKFEVSDVPIEQQIVPTSRPFNSVFGIDRSILDTPRNVTIISREQLTAINIQDVRDFSKLTASSYTRSPRHPHADRRHLLERHAHRPFEQRQRHARELQRR